MQGNQGKGFAETKKKPVAAIHASDGLADWLQARHASLAFTTGRAGRLFLVGCNPDGRLVLTERTLPGCTAIWADGQSLWVNAAFQLWRFENSLEPGQAQQGFDRMFIPQAAYTTGDLGMGSLSVSGSGRPLFTSTRFSCIAAPSATHHFIPLWKPPFISGLAPENRCQLTGMALVDGRPRYVTAAAETDEANGWQTRPGRGGIYDMAENRWVASSLHVPLAVGVHQDKLWVLDSGTGTLAMADRQAGACRSVYQSHGFPQAFGFVDNWAVVAVSRPPGDLANTGHLAGALAGEEGPRAASIDIVDLDSGQRAHWLRIDGKAIQRLSGVAVLPGAQNPQMIGIHAEAMGRIFSIAPPPHGNRPEKKS